MASFFPILIMQPLNIFYFYKNQPRKTEQTKFMNQDLEAKNCQQILRKNNLYPIKKLGKGGFGSVFLVSRTCIKGNETELFSVKCTNKKNFVKKPLLRRYLKQQIDIQSQMDHNNIVKLIRTFEDDGWNFMVMEYCDIGNLYNIQSQKPNKVFSLQEAKNYMCNILDGLKHLHQHNVIHRDLKSQNILLSRDHVTQQITAKICDFGFAKQTQQQSSTFCGTTYFMAPEIFAKKKYDNQVDIWAAGVIFYYMIFAAYPFKSMNMPNEIESKCKNGFNLQLIKGAHNESLTKEEKKYLGDLFQQIFRINPIQRISLADFRKKLVSQQSPYILKKQSIGGQLLLNQNSDDINQLIQIISQKIVFVQKTYQEIKTLGFLNTYEQMALKYYLDKYCLTLLLANNNLCLSNPTMAKMKKQLMNNQEKQVKILLPNLNRIEINKFSQVFNTVCSPDFSSYKESYRIVLSHVFSKANKFIQEQNLKSQVKLKIFCCHSINRVFDNEYIQEVFVHFFNQTNRKERSQLKINDISRWIEQESYQKINDTVRILCDKFYRKTK